MWRLLEVSCGAFLHSFFLGGVFLKASFKGDCPHFLMGFKVQNPTLFGPKYKVQNPIQLGSNYMAQNKISHYSIQFLQVNTL